MAFWSIAVLASHRRAFDPMEAAIGDAGQRLLADTEHLHADWTLVDDYPLSARDAGYVEGVAVARPAHADDRRQGRARGRSSIYVTSTRHATPGSPTRCRPWRAKACGCSASRAPRSMRTVLPGSQHDFAFEFLGWSPWRTRCGPDVPAGDRRVPRRWYSSRHDDRRPSGHRDLRRTAGGAARRWTGDYREPSLAR